jgi:putative tryptophan/tyrosine transport system substrate-binding protein
MKRRQFIAGIAGVVAAWPLTAEAQRRAIPVIGFLSAAEPRRELLAAFRRALQEGGYVEGKNLSVEYRWSDAQYDRLPALAAELVGRPVAVFVASAPPAALAAKAATVTIPIVFISGEDPVKSGLVASLNRPGGNITGFSFFSTELAAKRLGLLHELVPQARSVVVLVNPTNPETETITTDAREAASKLGLELHFVTATSERELDVALAAVHRQGADALLVGNDPYFSSRRDQIVALATSYAVPAMYENQFAVAGGLITYGPTLADAYHQAGYYVAQILNGARPAELPVQQPTKFVLTINLKAAKALGLTVPNTLLVSADEVIE